jgi:hypothetical protein
LVVALLAPAAYAAQLFYLAHLSVPWYLPVAGTAGVILLGLSLLLGRKVWRIVGLIAFGLLAAGEWHFVLAGTRLAPYTGPVRVGKPFPAFATLRADGRRFTRKDFRGEKDTALVFYRGWW